MARIKPGSILENTSGHVGKTFVIKQYKSGPVLSAFPDMSKAIKKKTRAQVAQRRLFANAVVYAQRIINNPTKKAAYARKLKGKRSVFQAALSGFMKQKTAK